MSHPQEKSGKIKLSEETLSLRELWERKDAILSKLTSEDRKEFEYIGLQLRLNLEQNLRESLMKERGLHQEEALTEEEGKAKILGEVQYSKDILTRKDKILSQLILQDRLDLEMAQKQLDDSYEQDLRVVIARELDENK